MKTITIKKEKAEELLKNTLSAAKDYVDDPEGLENLLSRLEEKLNMIPGIGKKLSYIPVMGSLLRSYVRKEYRSIPLGMIIAMIGAIIYFVSPIDFIPDFIPGSGIIDDAAVLAICYKQVIGDLNEYIRWRDKRHNIPPKEE